MLPAPPPPPPDPYRTRAPLPGAPPRSPSGAPRLTLDRLLRWALGLGLLALTVVVVGYFSTLALYLLIGVVLAYLLRPLVDRLMGLGLGRNLAILAGFVLVFGGLGVMVGFLIPFATSQLRDLSAQLALRQGARVTTVEPGGAAADGGLEPGDLILVVEDQPWTSANQLQTLLGRKQPGDSLRLSVERTDGTVARVAVPVRRWERDRPPLLREGLGQEEVVGALGLTLREVTLSDVASSVEATLRRYIPAIEQGAVINAVSNALGALINEDRLAAMAGSVVGVFTNLFYAVLVIPFVTFFVLKDGLLIRNALLRLVPNRYFEVTLSLVENIETNIGRYFQALLLQGLSVATVATVLLYAVGLDYAVAVGLFTGLANTIPYFGPLMGLLAGTLVGVAQTGNFSMLPGVLVAMGITQIADNVVFQPFIFSRAARAHPLVILFAVLMGAKMAGIVGMLVAIPVMTIVRVTAEQIVWSLRNYRILRLAR